MSRRSAFTLVELMIIIAILTNIMLFALPAFIRSRNMAQNTRYISDLRTIVGAFEMFAAENNRYPATATFGVIPSGMSIYLHNIPYSERNSLGGQWYWTFNAATSPSAIVGSRSSTNLDVVRMGSIDTRIDNGVLATGGWRMSTTRDVISIVEQ